MYNAIYSRLQSIPLVLRAEPLVFSSLSISFFFLTTGPTLSFLHLCLIASAPPYNHIGSQLSFGVVYIAVIVRVQCRDWALNVYSLKRKLCNKSGSGEEWGLGGWWGR